MTYIIHDVVDLNGESIVMPANSILKFKKNGRLINGVVCGNNTIIEDDPYFDRVRLEGSFKNQVYKTSWCSPNSMSDYIEDVMNISSNSVIIVDCDIKLNDQKKFVNHLTLVGKNKTITNSDRFFVTDGGTDVSNLKFRWDKPPVEEPKDNYDAVVIYFDMLLKDTTVVTRIKNVDADGGRYCSYFMRQYKSGIEPKLRTINTIQGCNFRNFTMGAIWTCGGSGKVCSSSFTDIGYEKSSKLRGVTALRLGYVHTSCKAKAMGYVVEDCLFNNIVAVYNPENDGRGLHGLLAYGDSIVVRNNTFSTLSTSFSKLIDTGMDSEMLYIKGSYNIIEGNTFVNGAGSSSNAIITLKSVMSEGNCVKDNHIEMNNNNGIYVYLCGCNHLIEGNDLISAISEQQISDSYFIYLGHREDAVCESVVINNNSFSSLGKTIYKGVYANRWGNITMSGNYFKNTTKILKCNNREGYVIMEKNEIALDGSMGKNEEYIIELTGTNKYQAELSNNLFSFNNCIMCGLVKGSNCSFNSNNVSLKNSNFKYLFRGLDKEQVLESNTVFIDNNSIILK